MEWAVLNKRLQEPWTAHLVSRQLNTKTIDDIADNFSRYGMKVALRVLISTLNMDAKRRSECADALKRLLDVAACDDQNEWVRIVAAIVRMRLDGTRDGDGASTNSLDETGDKILSMVKQSFVTSESTTSSSSSKAGNKDPLKEEPTFYFQPLELAYLSPELTCGIDRSSVSNAHFVVAGKRSAGPQFMQREEERAAETRKRQLQVQPMSRQMTAPPPLQNKALDASKGGSAAAQEKAARASAALPAKAIKKIVLPSKMAEHDGAYGKMKPK